MIRCRRQLPVLALAVAAIMSALVFAGCARKQSQTHSITVAGSTSVQPFVEMLAEEYDKKHTDMSVNVQGGGSSAGVQAAITGAAEIGMSSRDLKPDEKKAVQGILIARDAIAVVVHPSNTLTNIDAVTLRKIFLGEITSWKHFGWVDKPITVISREEGSGTRGAFDEMVMDKKDVSRACLVQDSNGSVRETVAQDRYAIGYVSLGLVNKSVKALSFAGIDPTFENASSGKYPLVRPFLFIVNGELSGLAKSFAEYVLSPEGQKILAEEGLIPVSAGKTR